MSDDLSISYSIIPIKRTEEVLNLLDKTFLKDEPLNCNKGFTEEDNGTLKEDYALMIQQGLSLITVDDKTGQVIGVRLSVPADRYQGTSHKKTYSAKVMDLFNLFEFANNSVDVYEKYDVDKILEFKALSVHPNYRRFGIATKLVQKSIELARSRGFEVVKVKATGKYSQKLFNNLDFDLLFEKSYRDYNDDGEVVFKNMGIHTGFQLLAKKI